MNGFPGAKKRLLIVGQHQFGYLTDSYAWCKYLCDLWSITYVGWDYASPRVGIDGVDVEYVSRAGSKPVRLARLVRAAIRRLRDGKFDAVVIVYFQGVVLLRPWIDKRTTLLDVRTGSDKPGPLRRIFDNTLLRLEWFLFKERTIISESLRKLLALPSKGCTILPLGGEPMSLPPKMFESLRLFYVGTLNYRSIHETVIGLDNWWRARKPDIDVTYDIVGSGSEEEQRALTSAIERSALGNRIRFHGRVPNAKLKPYLERCNVGVAYVPQVWFYDCQPSTKVFEYLLAGMPVIATRTTENALVIDPANGVLIEDSPEGFAQGVDEIYLRLKTYNSTAIRDASEKYSWGDVVRNILAPRLEGLLPHPPPGLPSDGEAGVARHADDLTLQL